MSKDTTQRTVRALRFPGLLLAAGLAASPALSQAPAAPTTPAAQPAAVSTPGIRSVSVDGLASVLQDQGYRAEITQGKFSPIIYTGMAGRRVSIAFYDCKAGQCSSIQYRLIFNKDDQFSPDFANAWNSRKRFAKAYVAEDGRFILEWDYDLDGGVSSAALRNSTATFQQMVGLLDQFIRERRPAAPAPQAPARSAERPA